jgi:hypothetical protein
MTVNFAPGDLVRARGREWVALPSPREGILALRPLSGSENDTVILDPTLETQPCLGQHVSTCPPMPRRRSRRRPRSWRMRCG